MGRAMVTLNGRDGDGDAETGVADAEAVLLSEPATMDGDALGADDGDGVRDGDAPGDRGSASHVVKSKLDSGESTGQSAHTLVPSMLANLPLGQSWAGSAGNTGTGGGDEGGLLVVAMEVVGARGGVGGKTDRTSNKQQTEWGGGG